MAKINYNSKAPQPLEPVKQGESSFYNVPDSTASNLVLDVLGAGADIADLPDRKRQVNHNTEYEVLEDGNKRLISLKNGTGTAEVTIELADIEKVTGSNKPAKKLFVLSLIKANEQAIHDGQLTKDYISFPLQELVDIGFYKSSNSARAGFSKGADILTSLKIKGKVKKSKKKGAEIEALEVLFTGARITKGQCYIFFNPRISWGFLTQYFTILPRYYFRLPNRASDLLYYSFLLARQHTKDIEERGYFTISFRAIQHKLQLPNEKGLNNPQRDIKDAIEDAIEQLAEWCRLGRIVIPEGGELADEFEQILHPRDEQDNILPGMDDSYHPDITMALLYAFRQFLFDCGEDLGGESKNKQSGEY